MSLPHEGDVLQARGDGAAQGRDGLFAQAADFGSRQAGARLGRDAREQRAEASQVVEVIAVGLEVARGAP